MSRVHHTLEEQITAHVRLHELAMKNATKKSEVAENPSTKTQHLSPPKNPVPVQEPSAQQ